MLKNIILVVFPLFVLCGNAVSAGNNLGELRNEVRVTERDVTASNYRWSDAVLNRRFAMAEEEFCRRTNAVRTSDYIVTITSQTEYDLPSDWINTIRVSVAILPLKRGTTTYKKIDLVTVKELDSDKGNPYFENSDPGIPVNYFLNLQTQKIGLTPPPNLTYTGSNLVKHEYAIVSSSMSADTDYPFDDISYLKTYNKALIPYVVSMCEHDKGNDNASIGWMQVFDAYVDRAIAELNIMITNKGGSFSAK